jgi:carbonyl reductase 1
MEDFKQGVKDGNYSQLGWPKTAYSVSKSGVTGITRILAEQEKKKGHDILINSCCPGKLHMRVHASNGKLTSFPSI